MSIVSSCRKCGRTAYVEKNRRCLNCLRKDGITSSIFGLHANLCKVRNAEEIMNEEQKQFPRVIHTTDKERIEDIYVGELDFDSSRLRLYMISESYRYEDYDGSKESKIRAALRDAYKDSVHHRTY